MSNTKQVVVSSVEPELEISNDKKMNLFCLLPVKSESPHKRPINLKVETGKSFATITNIPEQDHSFDLRL